MIERRLIVGFVFLDYPHDDTGLELDIPDDEEPLDLTEVLSAEGQQRMSTGDLIELTGNRLHNAFYIYRLPQKGIWAQIQQMWSEHRVTEFIFDQSQPSTNDELILVPAMDEYGYGVPYVFATRPTELLPDEVRHKYVDINCTQIAAQTENPTIALVQKHLRERLKDPLYRDIYMGEDMSVEPDRFPHEYVAMVTVNEGIRENVLWARRRHYDGQQAATNLNDNRDIFFSRRILEAEEQYRQKHWIVNLNEKWNIFISTEEKKDLQKPYFACVCLLVNFCSLHIFFSLRSSDWA